MDTYFELLKGQFGDWFLFFTLFAIMLAYVWVKTARKAMVFLMSLWFTRMIIDSYGSVLSDNLKYILASYEKYWELLLFLVFFLFFYWALSKTYASLRFSAWRKFPIAFAMAGSFMPVLALIFSVFGLYEFSDNFMLFFNSALSSLLWLLVSFISIVFI